MKLEIGKNNGYIVLDDNTGKIMSVMVKDVIENKKDFIATTSYSRKGDKHYNLR